MTHRAMQLIPIQQIALAPNLRKKVKKADISRIAATIKTCGLIHPIHVRHVGEHFEVVVGVLRFLAAREAGLTSVPAEVVDRQLSRAETIKLQYVENETRVDLDPMASARAVCDFIEETGLNGLETAAELGIDDTEVSRCKERVYDWCTELQELVESGKVAKSTGHIIHSIPCPEEKHKAMQLAAEGQLPRNAAIAAAKQSRKKRRAKSIAPAESTHNGQAEISRRTSGPKVHRFKASVAGGSVTITRKALTRDTVIAMLTALLARAQELASAGLADDEFFTGLHEVQLEMVEAVA